MKRFLGGSKKGGASSPQAPPSPPPPEEPQAKPFEESQSDTESNEEELPSLEEDRFLNHQAQELCREDRKWSFIEERGIRLKDFRFEETVKGYRWDEFIDNRGTAIGALVREFYANANECNGTSSWVRDFTIHYSEVSINMYYKFPVLQNNVAYTRCLSAVTPTMILKVPRANETVDWAWTTVDWAWTTGSDRKSKFLKEIGMNRDSKALNQFLAASFTPSRHTSEKIYAKCRVIYAIMVEVTPNVRRIIKDEIEGALKRSKATTSLPFPQLITKLCVNIRVEYSFNDELLQGKPLIRIIDLFCWDGAVVVPSLQIHQRATHLAASSSSAGSNREYYEQRFDAITAEQQILLADVHSLQDRMKGNMQWMTNYMHHMALGNNGPYAGPYPYPNQPQAPPLPLGGNMEE